MVDKFNSLSTEQQEQIVKWGAIASAVGPILWVFGTLVGAIGKISVAFGGLKGLLAPISKLFIGTTESVGLLGKVFALLGGPIGVVIGVLTALGLVLYNLYQTNEEFRNKVNEAWASITTVISDEIGRASCRERV